MEKRNSHQAQQLFVVLVVLGSSLKEDFSHGELVVLLECDTLKERIEWICVVNVLCLYLFFPSPPRSHCAPPFARQAFLEDPARYTVGRAPPPFLPYRVASPAEPPREAFQPASALRASSGATAGMTTGSGALEIAYRGCCPVALADAGPRLSNIRSAIMPPARGKVLSALSVPGYEFCGCGVSSHWSLVSCSPHAFPHDLWGGLELGSAQSHCDAAFQALGHRRSAISRIARALSRLMETHLTGGMSLPRPLLRMHSHLLHLPL